MNRQIFLFILALLSMTVVAQETNGSSDFETTQFGGLNYIVHVPTKVAMVQKTPDFEGRLNIPDVITYKGNNYVVEAIDEDAFNGNTKIIGELRLPKGLKLIKKQAFAGCVNITAVNLPAILYTIQDKAFCKCSGLTSLHIPAKIKEWGLDVFSYCTGLEKVTFAEGLTKLGVGAFDHCTKLTSITLPKGIKMISHTFACCESLKSVNLNEGLTDIFPNTFRSCTALTSVKIPDSVERIGFNAFLGCTNLVTISMGSKLRYIERAAFYKCSSLSSVNLNVELAYIGENAFTGCTALSSINIPDSVYIAEKAFLNTGLKTLVIPDGVTEVKRWAFSRCADLTTITIGKNIKELPEFWKSTNLSQIHCRCITPPKFSFMYSFSDQVYSTATVYVPKGTLQTYKTAEIWKQFQKIVEE